MPRKSLPKEKKRFNLQVYVEREKIDAVGGDEKAKEIAYKAISKTSKVKP